MKEWAVRWATKYQRWLIALGVAVFLAFWFLVLVPVSNKERENKVDEPGRSGNVEPVDDPALGGDGGFAFPLG